MICSKQGREYKEIQLSRDGKRLTTYYFNIILVGTMTGVGYLYLFTVEEVAFTSITGEYKVDSRIS